MRIVSWNMNHCMRSKEKRNEAWDYLRDGLRADLVLAQETSPPPHLTPVYKPIDEKNPRLNWGSAVVALSPGLVITGPTWVPLVDCYLSVPPAGSLPESQPGACAVADVSDARGRVLFTAISLYGQWEGMPGGKSWYACARVHRVLSDLTDILVRSRRRPVVLAGDFNISTQGTGRKSTFDEANRAAAAFARIRAWGMVDCIAHTRESRPRLADCLCTEGQACAHVRTFRSGNRPHSDATQLDYAFASQSLVPKMSACTVEDSNAAWSLSDHCPIVLDFDLPVA